MADGEETGGEAGLRHAEELEGVLEQLGGEEVDESVDLYRGMRDVQVKDDFLRAGGRVARSLAMIILAGAGAAHNAA